MAAVARILTLLLLLGGLSRAGQASPDTAAARAARLVAATDPQRERWLLLEGYASLDVVRALNARGLEDFLSAEFKRALVAFRTSQALAERLGADHELAEALGGAAAAINKLGDPRGSLPITEKSLRIFERLGDVTAQAEAWNAIGAAHWALNAMSEAEAGYRKAHDLWTSAGDRRSTARALNNIGHVHAVLSDFDEALALRAGPAHLRGDR